MISAADIRGASDSDRINEAIARRTQDGIVVIPPRAPDAVSERTCWLLDSAILLPENTTVILQGCTLKLSDRCRDNFFRTANCGLGITDPIPLRNIHLRGEGACRLIGADHPRSTGDGTKLLADPCPKTEEDLIRLADWIPEERRRVGGPTFMDGHSHTYGTDFGKPSESQTGDWRNVAVLFANVEDFSISGLYIENSHAWNVSCEACAHGRIENLHIESCQSRRIDGMTQNNENQDGIDLMNGCHDILVRHITGGSGDDLIALVSVAGSGYFEGGGTDAIFVMHTDWTRRDPDIHDITIRDVAGYSKGGQALLRLLPAGCRIYNVIADGLIDTSPDGLLPWCAVLLGEPDSAYGVISPDGIRGVILSRIVSHGRYAILLPGYLRDSVITHVVNKDLLSPMIHAVRKDALINVAADCMISAGKEVPHDQR